MYIYIYVCVWNVIYGPGNVYVIWILKRILESIAWKMSVRFYTRFVASLIIVVIQLTQNEHYIF